MHTHQTKGAPTRRDQTVAVASAAASLRGQGYRNNLATDVTT